MARNPQRRRQASPDLRLNPACPRNGACAAWPLVHEDISEVAVSKGSQHGLSQVLSPSFSYLRFTLQLCTIFLVSSGCGRGTVRGPHVFAQTRRKRGRPQHQATRRRSGPQSSDFPGRQCVAQMNLACKALNSTVVDCAGLAPFIAVR
jgi:hypothetical protein